MMPKKKKIVIAYSGGLDSYLLYHYAKSTRIFDEIKCIYWDHGQPVLEKELKFLPDFVEVRKVDWLNEEKTPVEASGRKEGAIFIPGRNMVFATLIACQELPDEIWMGSLHGETHRKGTDKNFQFLWTLNSTLNYVLGPFIADKIEVRFPFAEKRMNKYDIVRWARMERTGYIKITDMIAHTNSCHDPDTLNCGNCVQCVKRWAAFGRNGFSEHYDQPPGKSEYGNKMWFDIIDCLEGNSDYYDSTTIDEVWPWVREQAASKPTDFTPEFIVRYNKYLADEDERRKKNLDKETESC